MNNDFIGAEKVLEFVQPHSLLMAFLSIISFILIILIIRHGFLIVSMQNKKWFARFILFVLSLVVFGLSAVSIPALVVRYAPVTFYPETPNLTETAIKLGLYRLYVANQLGTLLSPQEEKLSICVLALSQHLIEERQPQCKESRLCIESMPPQMTREEIIQKINKVKELGIPFLSNACGDVDISF